MKTCSSCAQQKALGDFPKSRRSKDGHHAHCHICNRARVKKWKADNAERVKEYEALNRERISARERRNRMLRTFGLTYEEYEALAAKQEGLCAICKRPPTGRPVLSIDHCHTSGAVRGLLCEACNKALGFVRDDPQVLRQMIRYLENA